MYYLRTKPAANAIQFTVDKLALTNGTKIQPTLNGEKDMEVVACSLKNKEACIMCSS